MARAPAQRAGAEGATKGQIVVEVLLILPTFLILVFLIMELGYIAFQVIVTHHAAFEVARIGSMYSAPLADISQSSSGYQANASFARKQAETNLRKMIRGAKIHKWTYKRHGFADPQTGTFNADLVVTVRQTVRLVFPGSSYLLAKPRGSGKYDIDATVRMPVETPYRWTSGG